jgi:hypothetical protein
MRVWRIVVVGLVGGWVAGCAAASPVSSPPPAASSPAPLVSAPPAASVLAVASAAASPPAGPPGAYQDDGEGTPLAGSLEAKNPPVAPCDLTRVYRGAIGKTPVTVQLSRNGEKLKGLAHYDLGGPAIELTGKVEGDAVRFEEKGGGRFGGTCNGKSGQLAGTYELKKKATPFELAPRVAGEAALHAVYEQVHVKSPVPPECVRLGRTTETKFIKGLICLPSDPKALAELQKENNTGLCSLELSSPRLFGLASPGAERLANALLTHDTFGYAAADVRASVQSCPVGNETTVSGGFSIVYNANDVLSLFFSGYVSQTQAAHGALFGPAPMVIDLQTGKRLVIGDLVSNEAAFRDAIVACIPDMTSEITWGTEDSYRKVPRWVVVPGGIAVVMGDLPPVMNGGQGRGPIASFAALAARGWLRQDSPVARLWAGVKPLARDAPLCPTSLGSGEILARR